MSHDNLQFEVKLSRNACRAVLVLPRIKLILTDPWHVFLWHSEKNLKTDSEAALNCLNFSHLLKILSVTSDKMKFSREEKTLPVSMNPRTAQRHSLSYQTLKLPPTYWNLQNGTREPGGWALADTSWQEFDVLDLRELLDYSMFRKPHVKSSSLEL